ncbi:hypothetical protein SDC9_30330 [bioreactor metagenome]|uniref:Uncharacterized protein n=1 Tax=bioreactor metagenome TaxID=1076179 RepID=A0A644V037_9ZZZZ
MQMITFQNSFFFFGKVKELKNFLDQNTNSNLTVREFIQLRLQ